MRPQPYRRPWVVRDKRVPNVVLPPRQFRTSSPPDLPAWRDSMRSFAGAGMENWPQLLLAVGLLAYFTFLSR